LAFSLPSLRAGWATGERLGLLVGVLSESYQWSWELTLAVGGGLVVLIVGASAPFALGPLVGRNVRPKDLPAHPGKHRMEPATGRHRF
jgi:hypothetical protein